MKKIFWITLLFFLLMINSSAKEQIIPIETNSIKTVNGKFYAYLVLLFNENPHFINLIQPDAISEEKIDKKNFNLQEFKTYSNNLQNPELKNLAKNLLELYLSPQKFNPQSLQALEKILELKNIILKFSQTGKSNKIRLEYCIFGQKDLITTKHPLLENQEPIYNIKPFIYYDEFSTSNSTFYFDMVYINPEEVKNDFYISKKIMANEKVTSLFFVGSLVTKNIKDCLKKAFKSNLSSKALLKEINDIFIIHELTHKILNNKFLEIHQILGEELALSSTIYTNPFLGLAIFYSYLNYHFNNPHHLAALNFSKYIAIKKNDPSFLETPKKIKSLSPAELKSLAKQYFFLNLKICQRQKP